MSMYVHLCVLACVHMYGGQKTAYGSQFSLSVSWVSGINLRSACLAASVSTLSILPGGPKATWF